MPRQTDVQHDHRPVPEFRPVSNHLVFINYFDGVFSKSEVTAENSESPDLIFVHLSEF
jgi:hypothetical protein